MDYTTIYVFSRHCIYVGEQICKLEQKQLSAHSQACGSALALNSWPCQAQKSCPAQVRLAVFQLGPPSSLALALSFVPFSITPPTVATPSH